MPTSEKDKAHCRKCGGERWHKILHEEVRKWEDDDTPVSGGDTYEIIQCCGCDTVAFRHSHWFSEENDSEGNVIVEKDYYPPAPLRAIPDWEGELVFSLSLDKEWQIAFLLKDIYAAVGLKSYSLAAMGARAIIDVIITAEAGEERTFKRKLQRLVEKSKIDKSRADVIHAAFDAGSATAHRGHKPEEADVFSLLTIMESLLYQFRIQPQREWQQAKDAEKLKQRTPQRVAQEKY